MLIADSSDDAPPDGPSTTCETEPEVVFAATSTAGTLSVETLGEAFTGAGPDRRLPFCIRSGIATERGGGLGLSRRIFDQSKSRPG